MSEREDPYSVRKITDLAFRGLGRINVLAPKTLISIAVILFLTDFGYEIQRGAKALPGLIPFSLLSILLFLVLLVLEFAIVRRLRSDAARALGVMLGTVIAAVAKSLLLMFLLHGDQFGYKFAERVWGDITIALLYILIAATIFHAYENHEQVAQELNRTTARLAEQKATQIKVASDVEAELQQKANETLGFELNKLSMASEQVLDVVESSALKLQIQSLIRHQVRPLSRELRSRVEILRETVAEELELKKSKLFWKLRINPRLDASFIWSYAIAIPNIFLTILSKSDLRSAALVFLISLSYPIIGRLLQVGFPRKEMAIGYVLNLPAIVSLIAYAPTGIFIYWLGLRFPLIELPTLTAGGVLVFTSITATTWFALQRTRRENTDKILQTNAEIRHELDLLDQAVWVAQRKWSYIIHGTVQGSLVVASSRLEMAGSLDDNLKSSVKSDIQRAKEVLVDPPTFDRPLRELLQEIVDTWAGVCDLTYEISPSAEAAVSASQTSTICLVEIVKELISNAKRHGGATKFWLNAHLDQSGDLAIVAGNNGTNKSPSDGGGLGFEMISQLTRNWNFSGTDFTHFTTVLPLPRRSLALSN